ncbi:MAG: hypothetical protein K8R36_15315 [Planctomycetales bacterium]|nr:hypothetical protein [Planctomycetales bacterium]
MSRSRLVLLVLALASVFCLGDMRGDDPPQTPKGAPSSQVPDRLLKAIGGKGAKTAPAANKPATEEKEPAEKPVAKEPEKKAAVEEKPAVPEPAVKAPEIKPAKLTPKQISFVKSELIPAYQSGEPINILNLVSGQLARWTDPQIAGMNQLLAELHAPTLDKMITDARMNLVRAQMTDKGPEATAREAAIVLREIKRQIEEILKTAQGIELMKDPFPKPKSMTEFRDQYWMAHVQNNQLINAEGLAFQANLIMQSKVVSKAKNASAADKAIFATKFPDITTKIRTVHRELNERSVELRVERVKFAIKVLQDSKDIKERFFAAYAVGVDGELLVNGFKEFPGPFVRSTLSAPGYVEALTSDVERGKKLAGDMVKKSQLLFAGMHWWRRGRYGLGPELNGLLKSAAAQTNLAAQIPLNMPRVTPVPVDPAKNPLNQIPTFDRRHHFTWAWQTRQFQMTGTGSSSSSNTSTQASTSSIPMRMTPDFWNGNTFL